MQHSVTEQVDPTDLETQVYHDKNTDNKVPGPAAYTDVGNFSKVGRYIVSSHRGGTKAKFDVSKRITKFDLAARKSK